MPDYALPTYNTCPKSVLLDDTTFNIFYVTPPNFLEASAYK